MSEREQSMVAWMAQSVHQAHHEEGEWQLCPKSICRSAARWIRENPPHDGLPCQNCKKEPKEHPYGKCLFEPTHYREMTKAEHVEYLATELNTPFKFDVSQQKLTEFGQRDAEMQMRVYQQFANQQYGNKRPATEQMAKAWSKAGRWRHG